MRTVREKLQGLLRDDFGKQLLKKYFECQIKDNTSWNNLPVFATKNLDERLYICRDGKHTSLMFRFSNQSVKILISIYTTDYPSSKSIIRVLWGYRFGRIDVPKAGFSTELLEYLRENYHLQDTVFCGNSEGPKFRYYDTYTHLVLYGSPPRHILINITCNPRILKCIECELIALGRKNICSFDGIDLNAQTKYLAITPNSKIASPINCEIIRFADKLPLLRDLMQRNIKSAKN
jgi:hypothetical protein